MTVNTEAVTIQIGNAIIHGELVVPDSPRGIILFAHGSGSSRFSPRNRHVASILQRANLATLLFDLLSDEEEAVDEATRALRFDIELLTQRLITATNWLTRQDRMRGWKLGYFGSSTGAAAAIKAAALRRDLVHAVVSRGGRPDLAGLSLMDLKAPTLLIVGGWDFGVIELNQSAFEKMECEKKLEIVPGATHLFEEPGKLDIVADLASSWFKQHLI